MYTFPKTIRRALLQVDESYRTTLELFYVKNFSYIGKLAKLSKS